MRNAILIAVLAVTGFSSAALAEGKKIGVSWAQFQEERWKIDGALGTVIRGLCCDTDRTREDKIAEFSASLDDFGSAMLDWFGRKLDALAQEEATGAMSEAPIDTLSEAVKANLFDKVMEIFRTESKHLSPPVEVVPEPVVETEIKVSAPPASTLEAIVDGLKATNLVAMMRAPK